MLHEVQNVRQVPGEGSRRWFTDEFFDLIVWYGDDWSILGFQLCYGKNNKERALTWRRDEGFSHEKVDDGETPGHTKMTPVLVPNGQFDVKSISARFRQESSEIDPEIAGLVIETLDSYPRA